MKGTREQRKRVMIIHRIAKRQVAERNVQPRTTKTVPAEKNTTQGADADTQAHRTETKTNYTAPCLLNHGPAHNTATKNPRRIVTHHMRSRSRRGGGGRGGGLRFCLGVLAALRASAGALDGLAVRAELLARPFRARGGARGLRL